MTTREHAWRAGRRAGWETAQLHRSQPAPLTSGEYTAFRNEVAAAVRQSTGWEAPLVGDYADGFDEGYSVGLARRES